MTLSKSNTENSYCPFCGSEGTLENKKYVEKQEIQLIKEITFTYTGYLYVGCNSCQRSWQHKDLEDSSNSAKGSYNRRISIGIECTEDNIKERKALIKLCKDNIEASQQKIFFLELELEKDYLEIANLKKEFIKF